MLEESNGNSFGLGCIALGDVPNDVTRTFPLILQFAVPSYQFRNN